ncbi:MAG: VRR-NUC domain-containing protein [Alloalcanivorax venustensis]|uniref:VRR-NUC domain-containing protein n=1 Tax=Alloalcanivorax venustensis TaxID=172371 RepID=UPI003C533C70
MDSAPIANVTLDDPFYYLHHFQEVLRWVESRHGDLLNDDELAFVSAFGALPRPARALLVRMVMRKGEHFRADKLVYPEIGDALSAAAPLIDHGWLDPAPTLDLPTLFRLFTKAELRHLLREPLAAAGVPASARKADWLEALSELEDVHQAPSDTPVYHLTLMPLCDRFRLMFFGNLYQDWSEFVLSDLGTFQYEPVSFSQGVRPFQSRRDVDAYLHLNACRDRFQAGDALEEVEAALPPAPDSPWARERWDRLCFKLAREWERAGELERAGALYSDCRHPGARGRQLRVLERREQYDAALTLAREADQAPESEAERQQLRRLLPRLHRKLGLPRPTPAAPARPQVLHLSLPPAASVEQAAAQALATTEAPVYYVENSLIPGLFGLLFWDAIFAPAPGAFFHPFQSGPADLHHPEFRHRRRDEFDAGFQTLADGEHRARILARYREKFGRLSPFVHWGRLSEALLEQALDCLPADHLALCFERLLADIAANRAGLPDLIQFWPAQRRYRMVEVKGPGDRLQDNQRRWLDFFIARDLPVAVCQVTWQ